MTVNSNIAIGRVEAVALAGHYGREQTVRIEFWSARRGRITLDMPASLARILSDRLASALKETSE